MTSKIKEKKSIKKEISIVPQIEEKIAACPSEGREEIEHEEFKGKRQMSRTSLLIQDYLEFKAARSIQRFVRGWLYRTKYRRKRWAAIKIQQVWRRFYCQRMYYRKVEETLQQRIDQHIYRAAQRIQAMWRGWWVRHNVHDHTRKKQMQLLKGEDLLYCVAFKLHHLLRTHHIPGVYSLRNSSAFSKVEQLLISIKFKTFNNRSKLATERTRYKINEGRKQHKKSAYGTKVPFSGPNINNLCLPKCLPLFTEKDADIRMCKILSLYEEAHREVLKPKLLRKKAARLKRSTFNIPPSKSSSFCSDVVNSMRKWKIIKDQQLCVDSDVFKTPKNVENFLKEIESKMSVLQGNCYCRREFMEKLSREKEKYLSDEKASCENKKPSTINIDSAKLQTR